MRPAIFFVRSLTAFLLPSSMCVLPALAVRPDRAVQQTPQTDSEVGFDRLSPLIEIGGFNVPTPSQSLHAPSSDATRTLIDLTGHTPVDEEVIPNVTPPAHSEAGPSTSEMFLSVSGQPQAFVPTLSETIVPPFELWHIGRVFKTRLLQLHFDSRSLIFAGALDNVRNNHLTILKEQLQRQIDSKQAIFLSPTMDHQGRLFAVPIHSDKVKEKLIEKEKTGKVGWAIVGIEPGEWPKMTWFRYALLDVPDRRSFVNQLYRARNVKKLRDYLKPV